MNDASSVKKIDLNKTDWRGSREFFESLADELRNLDDKEEKYDFTWVGKRKAIIEAGAPINKTLRPDVKNSKNWDTTENLFIEGDNLDALKLLQESYLGKVKMIYIDPPYNTGKDFVYHDNFKVDVEQYDEATEYKDEEGNIQFKKNEKSNGRYHSDWLSMIYPRLKLARNLLSDDGVIFISIDDNEQANLKKLSDEVFGEENLLAQIVIHSNPRGRQSNTYFPETHEYVLVYAKQYEKSRIYGLELNDSQISEYSLEDEQGKYREIGLRLRGGRATAEESPTLHFPLYFNEKTNKLNVVDDGNSVEIIPKFSDGTLGTWRWSKPKILKDLNLLKVRKVNGSDGERFDVFQKDYLSNDKTRKAKSLWDEKEINYDRSADDFNAIQMNKLFDYAKPLYLLRKILIISTRQEDIILDFFSGSSTTAHAVMQLNAEDGGNRKWIMVQLPEETPEGSEARKAGFNSIPEIARERIRRAGDMIAKKHPDAKVDYGFRSLKIADTNYKEVYKPVGEISQESLLDTVDNIKEDRGDLDLLYGVLTQLALELNRPIETRKIADSTVYLYDYLGEVSGLVACFSDSVSDDAIKHIAGLKPLTAIFRDSSFADSQAKVNLAEHFRVISPDTKVRVI